MLCFFCARKHPEPGMQDKIRVGFADGGHVAEVFVKGGIGGKLIVQIGFRVKVLRIARIPRAAKAQGRPRFYGGTLPKDHVLNVVFTPADHFKKSGGVIHQEIRESIQSAAKLGQRMSLHEGTDLVKGYGMIHG